MASLALTGNAATLNRRDRSPTHHLPHSSCLPASPSPTGSTPASVTAEKQTPRRAGHPELHPDTPRLPPKRTPPGGPQLVGQRARPPPARRAAPAERGVGLGICCLSFPRICLSPRSRSPEPVTRWHREVATGWWFAARESPPAINATQRGYPGAVPAPRLPVSLLTHQPPTTPGAGGDSPRSHPPTPEICTVIIPEIPDQNFSSLHPPEGWGGYKYLERAGRRRWWRRGSRWHNGASVGKGGREVRWTRCGAAAITDNRGRRRHGRDRVGERSGAGGGGGPSCK